MTRFSPGQLLTALFRCSVLAGLALLFAVSATVYAAEITGKGFPVRPASSGAVPYAAPTPAPAVAQPASQPAPAVAVAQSTQPAQPATYENSPLAFAGSERQRARSGQSGYSMPSIWPALFAVMAVCGLFIGGLYLMKKYLPGHRQMFNHPAMELLGRTHLDQRRFVTLLRVGRRLVVVGVCQEEMRTLTEITDEGEITEILEVARPKTEVGLTVFQRLFQKNVVEAEAAENQAMANEKVAELDAQMTSLRARVQEIRSDADFAPTRDKRERARKKLDAVG